MSLASTSSASSVVSSVITSVDGIFALLDPPLLGGFVASGRWFLFDPSSFVRYSRMIREVW
jgi:hypothetical protein